MAKRILIVDDDPDCLEMLEERLKASGYDVVTASNGQEGLEKTMTSRPDLVIMDVLLPKMNGFQLCQRIKEDPVLASIPVMMLTAVYVDELDKKMGLKVGADKYLMKADGYMSKPFVAEKLLDNIKVLLGEKRPDEVVTKENILVIDDDPASLELLTARLEADGYEVITASNGEEGLEKVRTEKPGLVILDIQMPKMSGIDVLAKIRKEWPQIVVIMITAYGSEKTAIDAMRKGANDYITKPIDHHELTLRVKENLEKARLRQERKQLIAMLKGSNVKLMLQYENLRKTNVALEDKARELEKSKDQLLEKMETIEKFNRLAVNRELKMMELKERIKELEKR